MFQLALKNILYVGNVTFLGVHTYEFCQIYILRLSGHFPYPSQSYWKLMLYFMLLELAFSRLFHK